jgi:hypothetical protein
MIYVSKLFLGRCDVDIFTVVFQMSNVWKSICCDSTYFENPADFPNSRANFENRGASLPEPEAFENRRASFPEPEAFENRRVIVFEPAAFENPAEFEHRGANVIVPETKAFDQSRLVISDESKWNSSDEEDNYVLESFKKREAIVLEPNPRRVPKPEAFENHITNPIESKDVDVYLTSIFGSRKTLAQQYIRWTNVLRLKHAQLSTHQKFTSSILPILTRVKKSILHANLYGHLYLPNEIAFLVTEYDTFESIDHLHSKASGLGTIAPRFSYIPLGDAIVWMLSIAALAERVQLIKSIGIESETSFMIANYCTYGLETSCDGSFWRERLHHWKRLDPQRWCPFCCEQQFAMWHGTCRNNCTHPLTVVDFDPWVSVLT